MRQATFALVVWAKRLKITQREQFLEKMDTMVPWSRLLPLIASLTRDTEMQQTNKAKGWHFWIKGHTGTERHGIILGLSTTSANVSRITQIPQLLRGEERDVFGDHANWSEARGKAALAKGLCHRDNRRSRHRTRHQRLVNGHCSAFRLSVDHVFRVVKRLRGFNKVYYCGSARNAARLGTAPANLHLVSRRLLPS